MQNRIYTFCVAFFAMLLTTGLSAQVELPAPSPSASLETTIGLTDVSVEYSRPGVKGREIFGDDGLVPYGEIWRTGANSATKITFGDDVMVGGEELKAGSYAILSKPMASKWEIMFFPYEGGNWGSYVEKAPAATVTADVQKVGGNIEAFTIDFQGYDMEGADMTLGWADAMVAVPIKTNAMDQAKASIERVMAGPSMNDYFAASGFYMTIGENDQALKHVQKANEMAGDNPRFWMVHREALILGEMGMTEKAIATAKKSMMLAEEAGNQDYVRLNEKKIKEWESK